MPIGIPFAYHNEKKMGTTILRAGLFQSTDATSNLFIATSQLTWGFDWHMHQTAGVACNCIVARVLNNFNNQPTNSANFFDISKARPPILRPDKGPGHLHGRRRTHEPAGATDSRHSGASDHSGG